MRMIATFPKLCCEKQNQNQQSFSETVLNYQNQVEKYSLELIKLNKNVKHHLTKKVRNQRLIEHNKLNNQDKSG